MTGTAFNHAILRGSATFGLYLSGQGSSALGIQGLVDNQVGPARRLVFRQRIPQSLTLNIPQVEAPPGTSRTQSYGFRVGNPSYRLDASLTPQVNLRVRVGYKSISRSFSTEWISLNRFRINLGSVNFKPHAGTRAHANFQGGRKTVTNMRRSGDGDEPGVGGGRAPRPDAPRFGHPGDSIPTANTRLVWLPPANARRDGRPFTSAFSTPPQRVRVEVSRGRKLRIDAVDPRRLAMDRPIFALKRTGDSMAHGSGGF